MKDETELRLACMDCASTLDNDSVNDMVSAAEVIYLWVTNGSPDTRIEVDKKGNLNMNPNDN